VAKDFFDFHQAVNDACLSICSGEPYELFGDGFVVRTEPVGKNAVKVIFDIDPLFWSAPPIGKTLALDLGATHRMIKTIRRDPDGNLVKILLHTCVTPGSKSISAVGLPELWHTKSEGVRHRRLLARSRKFSGGPLRSYEYALVR
jgi:hypothetical protein